MTPDVFVLVTLSDSDDGAVARALNKVAAQEFRHAFEWRSTNIALHFAQTIWSEAAYDTTMTVIDFITIVQQPVADQWRDAALL